MYFIFDKRMKILNKNCILQMGRKHDNHCTINHIHKTLGPFVLRTDDFSA